MFEYKLIHDLEKDIKYNRAWRLAEDIEAEGNSLKNKWRVWWEQTNRQWGIGQKIDQIRIIGWSYEGSVTMAVREK